jgi:cytochrome P450
VTRDLPEDIVLPFDDGKISMYFKKGTTIMAPSWISQRYDEFWTKTGDQSPEVFYPERFLKTDSGTGIPTFTLDGSSGKLFPFGGGKTICPGRVFAKQEVLGAVAMVLLEFEIESVGYIDAAGKTVETFPGLKDAYLGAGAVAMDGDLKVRIKQKVLSI